MSFSAARQASSWAAIPLPVLTSRAAAVCEILPANQINFPFHPASGHLGLYLIDMALSDVLKMPLPHTKNDNLPRFCRTIYPYNTGRGVGEYAATKLCGIPRHAQLCARTGEGVDKKCNMAWTR